MIETKSVQISKKTHELLERIKDEEGISFVRAIDIALREKYKKEDEKC